MKWVGNEVDESWKNILLHLALVLEYCVSSRVFLSGDDFAAGLHSLIKWKSLFSNSE